MTSAMGALHPVHEGSVVASDSHDLTQSFKRLRLPAEKPPDIFDQEDFDAIKFINQIYPDESSLGDLDNFIAMLRKQIRAVDKEIFQAVRSQGGGHTRARQDLAAAQGQIQELFAKIRDIQRKAEESEAMVQEICRDIKKLDCAKKHLTNAITALRRLAMLTAAVSDLEVVAPRRDQYKRCANLLEAVAQLMDYFQQYEAIPKVRSLTRRIAAVQEALGTSVLDDFKLVMGSADGKLTAEALDRLSQACAVADALGPKVRDQLMDWLCDREMTIYQAIFSMSGEGGRLDRFERRFAWFKGRLDEKKEQWAIFPESWRVPQVLCLTFCKITKAHAKRILSEGDGSELAADISPLIKTVVAAIKFERSMNAVFGHGRAEDEDDEDDSGAPVDGLSASEARKRLEKFRNKARKEAEAKQKAARGAKEEENAALSFEGAISEAFEDSLRFYVAEEEKELLAYVDTCIKEEVEHRWLPTDEDRDSKILSSANKLFFKIRSSLTRCAKLISRGNTLLALSRVFKRALSLYATELARRLPRTASGATNASPPYHGTDWFVRISEDEEKVVCHILATAEFCKETTEGLSAALAKDLLPSLADKVDFSDEEGQFLGVSSQGLNVLVLGINTKLDAALQEMAKMRWDAIDQPGDDSQFVLNMRFCLNETARLLGRMMDAFTFSFFCDKMARMFIPRYYEAIMRIRKISDKGTIQLSVDTDALRRSLLEVPVLGMPSSEDAGNSSYAHYVEREMGNVINLVKVLQAKPDNLVETYMLLLPSSAQSVHDFTRLCDLKVLNRKQASDLIAAYTRRLAGGEGGVDASTAGLAALAPSNPTSLGALKAGMSTLTRELANTISFLDKPPRQDAHDGQGRHWGDESRGPEASLARPSVGSTLQGVAALRGTEISFGALKETAAKTKEGFAKIGSLIRGNAPSTTPAPHDISRLQYSSNQ